ncbi:hypothetical protein BMS3Abin07_02593 [bacterium BMS3Abin07]|nr:hypothetical protein BMS3Abin07_02593 [bacterium BMS3Abin07]GBE32344.1 hypothetical protein BMS3Bbin05_01257 [bacterium BMS3Bbin05]
MGMIEKIVSFFKPAQYRPGNVTSGRNDPCWCGSGKKYKKCHLNEDEKKQHKNYSVNCGPT